MYQAHVVLFGDSTTPRLRYTRVDDTALDRCFYETAGTMLGNPHWHSSDYTILHNFGAVPAESKWREFEAFIDRAERFHLIRYILPNLMDLELIHQNGWIDRQGIYYSSNDYGCHTGIAEILADVFHPNPDRYKSSEDVIFEAGYIRVSGLLIGYEAETIEPSAAQKLTLQEIVNKTKQREEQPRSTFYYTAQRVLDMKLAESES